MLVHDGLEDEHRREGVGALYLSCQSECAPQRVAEAVNLPSTCTNRRKVAHLLQGSLLR